MIFTVLITIPSNGQTLSTWSVFIIPDSVIIFRLWLAHWVQVLCLATRVSCSSLASSWPIRPRVWDLNRSVIPDLLAWASTMLWRGTKSNFYPLDLYIYIYIFLLVKSSSASPVIFINDYVFCRSSFWPWNLVAF